MRRVVISCNFCNKVLSTAYELDGSGFVLDQVGVIKSAKIAGVDDDRCTTHLCRECRVAIVKSAEATNETT